MFQSAFNLEYPSTKLLAIAHSCKNALAALLFLAAPAAAAPPNIVLIVADDLGGSFAGQGVPTPNISAIGSNGAVFTNAYASPACVPSRAKLMTGRQEQAMGIYANLATDLGMVTHGLPTTERTIADHLRALGYATGIFGKWHLGQLPQFRPLSRGFREGHYVLASGSGYLPPADSQDPFYHNGSVVQETRYSTTAFGQEAAAFIRRNASRPFFLYAPFTAPHEPLEATAALMARVPADIPARRRPFVAVLLGLDDAVGAILAVLREKGLERQTIVVFMGDNGCRLLAGCLSPGLRGAKGSQYEGGVRVPFAISWPGSIPSRAVAAPVMSFDLLPTFMAAAGAPIPANVDGVNLLPYLQGQPGQPHKCLAWGAKSNGAIRCGDWKLIRSELYNLRTDPGEGSNVASANPAKVAELRTKRAALVKDWLPPIW
jgi:arylsulfatase A-like enzyme